MRSLAPEAAVVRLPASVSTSEASCLLLAQVGCNGASRPSAWQRGKELTVHCPDSLTRDLVTRELPLADAPRAYDMLLDREAEFPRSQHPVAVTMVA